MTQIVPSQEKLAKLVFLIRGEKVLIDTDLAELYGVATKVLNQAVKRNLDRFPADFMFQLTPEEWQGMRSQTVTASRRNIGALPYTFTEQGVAMLSSVLRSQRAVEVNIAIMRTFVQLRRLMDSHRDLRLRIEAMETRYDEQISGVRCHQTTHHRRQNAQSQTTYWLSLTLRLRNPDALTCSHPPSTIQPI